MFNPVARSVVHRCQRHQQWTPTLLDADDTDNYALQTNHGYIGSFGRIPNKPKPFSVTNNLRAEAKGVFVIIYFLAYDEHYSFPYLGTEKNIYCIFGLPNFPAFSA